MSVSDKRFNLSISKQHIIAVLILAVVVIAIAAIVYAPASALSPNSSILSTSLATANETSVPLRSLDIEISIKDDETATWRVEMAYTDRVSSATYLVLADVTDLNVEVDGERVSCSTEKRDVGTLLICPQINGNMIIYSFKTPSVVRHIGALRSFDYTFRTSARVDFFALKISLPLGSVLADPTKLEGTGLSPMKPEFGREGSNGRQILVSWEITTSRMGDIIDASVLYEPLTQPESPMFVFVVAAIAILVGGFIIWSLYARNRPERLLPALSDRERPVMELIIKHKSVDQRDIVQALGWPKAKVSRAMRVLSDRGLIEALPKGRTKELRLLERQSAGSGFTKRIFGFKMKQRSDEMGFSRSQAVELVQTTITPLMDWTDRILRRIHVHKFGYAWNDNLKEFALEEDWVNPLSAEQRDRNLKDVKSLAPKIDERSAETAETMAEVEKSLDKLAHAILSNKKFVSACKPQRGSDIKSEQLVRHAIDRDKVINDVYPWARFWNTRSAELLKLAEDNATKKLHQELVQNAAKLGKSAREFREELENVREHLRKQYHILYKEYRA